MHEDTPALSRLRLRTSITLSFCANAAVLAAGGLAAYLFNAAGGQSFLFGAQPSVLLAAIQAAGWLLLGQGVVALLLALALQRRAENAWGLLVGYLAVALLLGVVMLEVVP